MPNFDAPLVAFFKHVLDPLLIVGVLWLITLVYGEDLSGEYIELMLFSWLLSIYFFNQTATYRSWQQNNFQIFFRDTFIGWGLVIGALTLIRYITQHEIFYSPQIITAWLIITPFGLLLSHIVLRIITVHMNKEGELQSAVVVGVNENSLRFVKRISEQAYLQMNILGYFDSRSDVRIHQGFWPKLGEIPDIVGYVQKHNVQVVYISLPMSHDPRILEILDGLHDTTASVYFLPDIQIFDLMQARINYVGGTPVVGVCESSIIGIDRVIKDISDYVLALLFLIILSPLMLGIALVVKLTSPGPAIFKQRRYGLNGEEIIVYKFRTMKVSEDGSVIEQAHKSDPRITKFGAFMRRTSLDELPQFFNVLQGRMSIVGPRPHAVSHNELYRKLIKGYMLRHKLKPGITGWAQVNGMRGETEVLEKMQARIDYDLQYLNNWSMWLDLRIILKTVWVVLRRDHAY